MTLVNVFNNAQYNIAIYIMQVPISNSDSKRYYKSIVLFWYPLLFFSIIVADFVYVKSDY